MYRRVTSPGFPWKIPFTRDGRFVGFHDDFGPVRVDVKRAEDENESGEGRVGRDRLQPIVIQIEQNHLRLRRFQYKIAEFLHLEMEQDQHQDQPTQ